MYEIEQRRAEVERHRENSARQAQVFARFETRGAGAIEFEDRIDFGLTFIDEPYVSYGCSMDLEDLAERLELDPEGDPPPIPITTGVVTEWDRDDRDFYVGAWVAAHIYFPRGEEVGNYPISHYFTFHNIAIKDVPVEGGND